jgi:hypothetical protein
MGARAGVSDTLGVIPCAAPVPRVERTRLCQCSGMTLSWLREGGSDAAVGRH